MKEAAIEKTIGKALRKRLKNSKKSIDNYGSQAAVQDKEV